MRRLWTRWLLAGLGTLQVLALAACDVAPVLESVDDVRKRLPDKTFIGDELGTSNFKRLQEAFARGTLEQMQLHVYYLAEPAADPARHVHERAEQLGLKSRTIVFPDGENLTEKDLPRLPDETAILGIADDKWEFAYDRFSGAESVADKERFHAGDGVNPDKIDSEGFYLAEAQRYLKQRLEATLGNARLYPYKMRRYLNAVAKAGEKPRITVSQVAISLNTAIDGLPIIGSGGKVSVHMTPIGEVVAYEASLRPVAERVATLTGKDLLEPRKAQAQIEARLKERGLDLTHYTLVRAEFGYYRRGRNSLQRVLAPYYAFVYEPQDGDRYGRKLVELHPAITDPKILAMLGEEEQREVDRKKRLMRGSEKPDVRQEGKAVQ